MSKVKAPTDFLSGENPLPSSQKASWSCCLTPEGLRALLGVCFL